MTTTTTPICIPRVGFGTHNLNQPDIIIYEAIKRGYRHFDCAIIYGNEKDIGRGIKRAIDENIVTRKDLFITSKVWNSHHAATQVKESCEKTLKDLGLTYLDLFLIHWPVSEVSNTTSCRCFGVSLSETWSAMENLVELGLVKHIGVSNFEVQLLRDLLTYCKKKPVVNQIECHVYFPQTELRKFCDKNDIIVVAYCPLAKGENRMLQDPVLKDIAQRHKISNAQVMLIYLLQMSPNIIVIPSTSNISRLDENKNIWDIKLTADDICKLTKLNTYR